MNREQTIDRLNQEPDPWDFIVIGGGATGLGTAVDAASRGYRTLLIEREDFAHGTSSRSTKLIHGGVRYLRQGNLSLVISALRERGRLHANAPHLVHRLGFVIPVYRWRDKPFYGIGLKLYDRLAGKLSLGSSQTLSKREAQKRLPNLETKGLTGGILYYDAQFDDARLAVNLAQTAAEHGAAVLNQAEVTGFIHEGGQVAGVLLRDRETGNELEVRGKAVVNATGVFTDSVRLLDNAKAEPLLVFSRGSHLVLPRKFLSGPDALMVPKTADGRVLFAIPWHDRVIVGTTDVPVPSADREPAPRKDELQFLLEHAAKYLQTDPQTGDVLSVFSGLRPLISRKGGHGTAGLSRDHTIVVSPTRLLTVTGGKWTTYRKMAEDVVNRGEQVAGFSSRRCPTAHLPLHGGAFEETPSGPLAVYGTDSPAIEALKKEFPDLAETIHPRLPISKAEIVWAARHEMARTVYDVLARRTRSLILDAAASMDAAPEVARLVAKEINRDDSSWQQEQVASFQRIAATHLIENQWQV